GVRTGLERTALEPPESQLPFAIVEARRVEEALAVGEEPRPAHARFAVRSIAGHSLARGSSRGRNAVDRLAVGLSHEDDAVASPGTVREIRHFADRHRSAGRELDTLQLAVRE